MPVNVPAILDMSRGKRQDFILKIARDLQKNSIASVSHFTSKHAAVGSVDQA